LQEDLEVLCDCNPTDGQLHRQQRDDHTET
jgi:hypothetical protein